MYSKETTCCFTGHRIIRKDDYPEVYNLTMDFILNLYNKGYSTFITGGALGYDTIAATSVINARSHRHDIKLVLALPCIDQTKGWNDSDIKRYEEIKSQADNVVYTSQAYTSDCMHIRNRYLVDNSSSCIAYQYKQSGGTFYTINYARDNALRIFNIVEELNSLNT